MERAEWQDEQMKTNSIFSDDIWDRLNERIFSLASDILSRKATTTAGLAVQTRALMLTNNEFVVPTVERGGSFGSDTVLLPVCV